MKALYYKREERDNYDPWSVWREMRNDSIDDIAKRVDRRVEGILIEHCFLEEGIVLFRGTGVITGHGAYITHLFTLFP